MPIFIREENDAKEAWHAKITATQDSVFLTTTQEQAEKDAARIQLVKQRAARRKEHVLNCLMKQGMNKQQALQYIATHPEIIG
jgi:hypothetical protein